jgi:hypothetical protein
MGKMCLICFRYLWVQRLTAGFGVLRSPRWLIWWNDGLQQFAKLRRPASADF